MDELFDAFEAAPAPAAAPRPTMNGNTGDKKNLKRTANGILKSETDAHDSEDDSDDGEVSSDASDAGSEGDNEAETEHKRPRLEEEPEPIVADTFETEQQREVAAGGLAGDSEADRVILSHQVRHQVALPPDYAYTPISEHKPPAEPAKTYEFQLDPFQQVSIYSIQRNESVLVSAHTSAGKTVVAEYAIAQCVKNNQRVIYTSPIKALSNQKYREFQAEFGDVGLMTGDVTINPTATCLVMTTEILRSMLYRGSEIMREVGWVIFDEIHYLRDKTRGVVWEETIILLPDKVRYVFLSATIPNAMQFAEWITKIHKQPCHVVYTDFRPTPLQHYFFPSGADGINLIVDEKGVFREENFQKSMSTIAEKEGDDPANAMAKRKGRGKDKRLNKGGTKGPSDIWKIVRMIITKNYNPVIVFSFSKRDCEAHALQMASMVFNDDSEKAMVRKVFDSALETLAPEDKELPQIQHLLPLLQRGIGIHHAGLLPILKETIEILFQEGLIKVLFATETFSIGLNMPAKTVVFTNVRKFDGVAQRWLTASEFIQMSGRAGRRGLDDRGIVIMMINQQMEPDVAKSIVRGEQDKLNSAFYLGYNMVLNLLRVEGISPEFMLEHCFHQFQSLASVSDLEKELRKLDVEKQEMIIEDENLIKAYYELRKQLDAYAEEMRNIIIHPNFCLPFMQPGRLVHIKDGEHDFGWGAVINFLRREPDRNNREATLAPQESWTIDVALECADSGHSIGTNAFNSLPPGIRPASSDPTSKSCVEVVPVLLKCVHGISTFRIFPPRDLTTSADRAKIQRALAEVQKRFPDGIPKLDPIEQMNITDNTFKDLVRKIEVMESRLVASPLHNSPRLERLWNEYAAKVVVTDRIREIKKKIQDAHAILQLDELKNRKRVLRRLQFINDDEVVQLKARVACQISTGDELMLSELLFNRFFNDLSPEEIAAVCSCFVFEERVNETPVLPDELARPLREIQKQAKIIAKVSVESKMAVNEEEYVQGFKWQLMPVLLAWAQGKSFGEICKMTDVYEGSLIRTFRRLEELLRQMGEASKVMGSEELEKKFDEALKKVRRDIVAAQSLYL
ncbi:ATP-dependent RNA helicase mtr4 [Cyphellophora attinorum]|uniref:ATP-dependent RNA helicase mtr4 n=1 Tax=Cyphellophora attinorum TaxID=1664694 RepID=A0A0N1HEQ2_9EURO|nr:ATP-dependent RNA helicase mtr4 [Phialophora attinorum]KPI43976.1 ATP-dependent RNA helicase mtr4 [Phialophora attinorum]